jgi:putative inorganic carbon (hco3(-)) transporter
MLPYNFGLSGYLGWALYIGAVACFLLTIFWRPIFGIYYLIPLIPLQTIRYKLNAFPLGASVVGLMLAAVALGLLRQRRSVLTKTPWTVIICVFGSYTLVSLWQGWLYLGGDMPLPGEARFSVWLDFIMMPGMMLLVAAIAPDKRHIRAMILLMALSTLALNRSYWSEVSGRDYSSYSEDLRNDAGGGSMGYAGSNGLAAFEAQFTILLLAISAFEPKRLLRVGYIALATFSIACLAYSLSRGGYAAVLMGSLFIGIVKQRKLLLLLVIFAITWTAWVPAAVRDRVLMTYDTQDKSLDASAETRVTLWEDAMEMFRSNPLLGTGFNTYAYMHRIRAYEDTHNYYLKVLVEMGVAGLIQFLLLLWITFRNGFRLYRRARDPLFSGLGLGLAGWVVAAVVANCFGDRFTYPQINGFMWILAGLVARGWALEASGETNAKAEQAAGMGGNGATITQPANLSISTTTGIAW